MNMEYGLAGTLVAVEYQAVTVFIDAFISSDLPGDKRHLARYCYVLVLEVINCRNMLLRYDQNMRWRLWIDVPEGNDVIVLIHLVAGNLTVSDLAKQAIGHACSPLVVFNVIQPAHFNNVAGNKFSVSS